MNKVVVHMCEKQQQQQQQLTTALEAHKIYHTYAPDTPEHGITNNTTTTVVLYYGYADVVCTYHLIGLYIW